MERFPIIITIGAGLLGWIAGEMIVSDPAIKDWVEASASWLEHFYVAKVIGAAVVIAIGMSIARRAHSAHVSDAKAG